MSTHVKPSGLRQTRLSCGCLVNWRIWRDGQLRYGRIEYCAGGHHESKSGRGLYGDLMAEVSDDSQA